MLRVLRTDLVSACAMWHQPVGAAGPQLISLHSFHAVCFALRIDCPTLHVPQHHSSVQLLKLHACVR